MPSTPKLCGIGAIALLLSLSGTVLAAPKHPGYSRAMDDLIWARALLQRTNGPQAPDEVSLSNGNIEAAMTDIVSTIGPGAKNPNQLPRIDARMRWVDRLSLSLKMLEQAKRDCNSEKENAASDELRARVLDQLDHAYSRLTVAVQTANFDYTARNIPTRND